MDYYEYYKEYSKEGSKVGTFVLVQQTIFQLGTVFAVLFLMIAIGLFSSIHAGEYDAELFSQAVKDASNKQVCIYLGSAIMQIVSSVCFVVFALQNKEVIKNAPLGGGKTPVRSVLKAWLFYTSVCIAIMGFKFGMSLLLKGDPSDHTMLESRHRILMFALTTIFPGIVEELQFRGVLFRYLRRRGFFYAALVSSVIFGLAHLNIFQSLFAFTLGFSLCYVYEKTRHIWICMILHCLHNSMILLITTIYDQRPLFLIIIWLGTNALIGLILIYFNLIKPKIKTDRTAIKRTLTSTPMMIFIVLCAIICVMRIVLRF